MAKPAGRDPQRIAKLLARAGIASRREIERMIGEGRIALDGKVLDTPATLLPSLRGVTVDGEPVSEAAPARLFLFHKPAGVLTAARDPAGRATIYDRLPEDLPRLMPVGRLDLNTEGLLLLTSDGELKRQLELPATGVERSYRARAFGAITQAQLEALIEGIEIDGVRYGSIDANLERRTGANVWVEMTLTEGKNREVRRVVEHLGLRVSRLIRTRYGPFVLGDMPVGSVGEVRQVDLIGFRRTLGKAAQNEPIAIAVEPHAPVPKPAPEPTRVMRTARAPAAKRLPAAAERPVTKARTPSERRARPADDRPRPSRADAATADEPTATPSPRPKRKAGWAKPKPRPGAKPRTPRR